MQRYIGTKIIQAEPRDKDYGPSENHGEPGYTVVYPDGYTSWSPKAAFEEAYRAADGLPFGLAIEAAKKGLRVTRATWPLGVFVYYVPPASYPVQTGAAKEHFGEGSVVPYLAYLAIKRADDQVCVFSPGMDSVLAEDWQIIE